MEKNCGIALFDMDSTLADYGKAMNEQQLLLRAPREPVYQDRPDDKAGYIERRRRLIQSIPGFWRNLERISLGFDVLSMTKELGFNNNILTKGPQYTNSAWTEKKEWCDEHVPDLDVHISQNKSMVYGKLLCDDWPEYFMPWLDWRPRGLVICVEQPWNKDIKHPSVVVYNGSNRNEVYNRIVECSERKI
jgi:hypothetical protein